MKNLTYSNLSHSMCSHNAHNMHSLLHHTHEALGDLIKDAIKSKLKNDTKITEKTEQLANMGYSIIKKHIDIVVKDISVEVE